MQRRNNGKETLITQAEYARRTCLNRSTITRLVQRGVILLHDGLVEQEESDRRRGKLLHPFKGAKRGLRAEESQDGEPLYAGRFTKSEFLYLYGVAFCAHALHDPGRISCLAETALECKGLDLSEDQAFGVARLLSLLIALWLSDYFKTEWPGSECIPAVRLFLDEASPEAAWLDRFGQTGKEEPMPEIFESTKVTN